MQREKNKQESIANTKGNANHSTNLVYEFVIF